MPSELVTPALDGQDQPSLSPTRRGKTSRIWFHLDGRTSELVSTLDNKDQCPSMPGLHCVLANNLNRPHRVRWEEALDQKAVSIIQRVG